jgi:hypothetical protein
MSTDYKIPYATYKSTVASTLHVYYLPITGGYSLYSSTQLANFTCIIASSTDVADFEATLQPTATAVTSLGDAVLSTIITNAALAAFPLGNKITDGVSNAAVKAASTSPLSTDPALVVAISPNSSITTTSASVSTIGSAPPTSASYIGGSDGAALRALAVDTSGRAIISTVDGQRATYSAAVSGLVVANTPTDIFTITGSASKTIRITRISFTGTQTTGTQIRVIVLKRSTANSGGTSTSPARVPHDSNNAAATATVLAYTANPTTGTLVGNIRAAKVLVGLTTVNSDQLIIDFGTRNGQGFVLRGTTQVLAINLAGVTIAGNSLDISFEWTEE